MTQRAATAAAILAATILPAQVQAQSRSYAPAGEWELNEQDEYCQFTRAFTAGADTLTLYFTTYGPVGGYRMSMVGNALPRDDARARVTQVSFDGSQDAVSLLSIRSSLGDEGMLTFQLGGGQYNAFFLRGRIDPGNSVAALLDAANTSITVSAAAMDAITVEFGPLNDVLTQMQACEMRLLDGWGYEASAYTDVVQQPQIQNGSQLAYWIRYPPNMVVNHTSTLAQIRLTVGADGQADDCVVQVPNWPRRRTREICRAIESGAEFTPALNAAGEPISALYRFSYLMVMFD